MTYAILVFLILFNKGDTDKEKCRQANIYGSEFSQTFFIQCSKEISEHDYFISISLVKQVVTELRFLQNLNCDLKIMLV